jgi:glycosyltransferase involved in cell wall biosynthesis/Tfp pilus assembly protein PilF
MKSSAKSRTSHQRNAPFFILSTGRSGTTSISRYFSAHAACECLHEPDPRLIHESSAYRYGEFDHNRLVEILRDTRFVLDPSSIYGESNQTLSLIIPALNSAFPDAKYVWLIRSGLDVVASAVGRNWYAGLSVNGKEYENSLLIEKAWIDGRIQGDRCGDIPADEWIRLTSFEKCCWYWGYINRIIEKDLIKLINPKNVRMVTLEEFASKAEAIAEWLGLQPRHELGIPHKNRAHYSVYHNSSWASSEWDAFERRCGTLMDLYYPDWRRNSYHQKQIAYTEQLIESGQFDQADQLLSCLQVSHPECARLYNTMGVLAYRQNRIADSRTFYKRAVSLDSENICYRMNLADLVHYAQNLPGEAIADYQEVLKRDPLNTQALMNTVQICLVLGWSADAAKWAKILHRTAPQNSVVRQFLDQVDSLIPNIVKRESIQDSPANLFCPVCDTQAERFLTYGVKKRSNACCPRCGAMERHRLLWLYLQTQTDIFRKNIKMLDVAPSNLISERLKSQPNIDYLSIDLQSARAMRHMDLTNLELPKNEFDFILCYHVLEHIPEDRKALSELFRVLKPGGWAIIQVPLYRELKETLEDPSVTDPKARERIFGQKDHVRKYSPNDYKRRLAVAGFRVEVSDFARKLSPAESSRFSINTNESLHICFKPEEACPIDNHEYGTTPNETDSQSIYDSLYARLFSIGWEDRLKHYRQVIESAKPSNFHDIPEISVIVISWRLHPDTENNFKILQKQRNNNFELIFVDNGAAPEEFEGLKKYADTYIRLTCNTGAYMARNIGAVFARAPILFFLEDDGIPADNILDAHLRMHACFDVNSVRGVYRPKTKGNHLNIHALHYDMGDRPFPWYVNLEGNASYRAEAFFAVGGWDDTNRFGHGGPELAYRLYQYDPEYTKQIYSPDPVIFHDYANDQQHLMKKREKQNMQLDRIRSRYPNFDDFIDQWKHFYLQSDTVLKKRLTFPKQYGTEYSKSINTYSIPSISVVIPTHNRVALLKDTLDSVIAQNVQPSEILIIDDGSTDGTQEFLRSLDSNRLRYITKPHTSAPDTRNRGISEARGDYILWVDDDDILAPGALNTHLGTLAKYPEADVVYGALQVFDHATGQTTKLANPKDWFIHSDLLPNYLMLGCPIPNPGTLVRRSAYDVIGKYDLRFLRAHDYDFWTRAVPTLSFKKNHSIVCRYRIHQTNMSAGDYIDFSYESLIVRRFIQRIGIRKIFSYWDWSQPDAGEAAAIFMIADRLFKLGDYFNARNYLHQIPKPMWTPEIMELAISCSAYLGDREMVAQSIRRYQNYKNISPKRPQSVHQHYARYFRKLDSLAKFVTTRKFEEAAKYFKMLIDEKHPLTSEIALLYGKMISDNVSSNVVVKLAHKAVQANPSEEIISAAVKMVGSSSIRNSLEGTRNRILFDASTIDMTIKNVQKNTNSSGKRSAHVGRHSDRNNEQDNSIDYLQLNTTDNGLDRILCDGSIKPNGILRSDRMPSVSIITFNSGSPERVKTIRRACHPIKHFVKEIFWISDPRSRTSIRKLITAKGFIPEKFVEISSFENINCVLNRLTKNLMGDVVVVLNEHVQVQPECIAHMVRSRQNMDRPGVSGPLISHTNNSRQNWSVKCDLGFLRNSPAFRNRYLPTDYLDDSFFLFDRQCLIDQNPFDEHYQSLAFALKDFCRRLQVNGFQNYIVGDWAVFRDPSDLQSPAVDWREDHRFFSDKWGHPDLSTAEGRKAASLNRLEQAVNSYEKGNLEDSLNAAHSAISTYPDNWPAYQLVLDVLSSAGPINALPECLQYLEKRTKLPSFVFALIGHGYEGTGDFQAAQRCARQALKMDRESSYGWNLQGIIAYRAGDLQLAEQSFRQAIALKPAWGDPWTNLGALLWDKNRTEEAIDCFERGFALTPTAANVASAYHTAVSATGRFDRALPFFKEAAQRYPNFRQVGYFLVDILIRIEDWPTAMAEIERLLLCFESEPKMLEAATVVRSKIGPMEIRMESPNRTSISLCMIVRNEEQLLPRCLASLKPIVDEMVVVDTGSTDSTKVLAGIFGAKIFDFSWHDDFSAARNYALSQANGSWILVLDADEVIATQDHVRIRDAIAGTPDHRRAFAITTRNYTLHCNSIDWHANDGLYAEEAGAGWFPSEKVRLFPNDPAIRFEYPVHELVDPSLARAGFAIVPCPVPVHHYGKLDAARADQKCALYYGIGQRKLSALGENHAALRELAVQAGVMGKQEEAIGLWRRLLKLEPRDAKALVNLSALLANAGQYDEAAATASGAVSAAPEMREAAFNLARCRLLTGHADEAAQGFARLTAANVRYYPAVFLQGCAEICSGRPEDGLRTLKSLQSCHFWPVLAHSFKELGEALCRSGQSAYAENVLEAAEKLGHWHEDLAKLRAAATGLTMYAQEAVAVSA